MGWAIFIHPQLWCRLFDCLLTCWTITFHTIKALQPEFANNYGFPPLIQDLFDLLTGLTTSRNVLNELQLLQRCVLTFNSFGYSHRPCKESA